MAKKGSQPKVYCTFTRMVAIEEIIPNPRNPNKHPKKQIELLAKIIKAQGWRAPITVSNRSGFIVRGHARLEAAKLLGLTECPVDFQDYDNEAVEWADCYLGSGSTLIACEKLGRKCYGMEIDPHYCDVILKRWEDFTGKTAELINE